MFSQAEKEKLFEQILRKCGLRLQLLARKNANSNSYEDLQQDIFLQIWKSLDRYQGKSSVETWSFGVAKRIIMKFHRTTKRAKQGTQLQAIAVVSTRRAEDERVCKLEKLAQDLDGVEQTILFMYLGSHSYQEISEKTALEGGALRTRFWRLRNKLRQYGENKNGSRTAQDRIERTGV